MLKEAVVKRYIKDRKRTLQDWKEDGNEESDYPDYCEELDLSYDQLVDFLGWCEDMQNVVTKG